MGSNGTMGIKEEKLIPSLVVILGNDPYHSVKINKFCQTEKLASKEGIPFLSNMNKLTLYEVIQRMKPRNGEHSTDKILQISGHVPLCLPPYHPELNPIENIWSTMKGWVAS